MSSCSGKLNYEKVSIIITFFFSVFKINFFFSEIESIKIKENDEKMKLRSQLNQEKKLTEEVKLKNS